VWNRLTRAANVEQPPPVNGGGVDHRLSRQRVPQKASKDFSYLGVRRAEPGITVSHRLERGPCRTELARPVLLKFVLRLHHLTPVLRGARLPGWAAMIGSWVSPSRW
jgi:hypothetical protein